MSDSTVRLLLVDDHPLVRDGLRARLEAGARYRVVAEAGDAAGALAAVAEQRPDLVLMDIAMRGINGLEATRRLLAAHPGLPVLILTMHEDAGYVAEAASAGARGYVLKDAPAEAIVEAIEAVLAGAGFQAPAGLQRNAAVELTPREREIATLIGRGLSNRQIAEQLSLSARTVETHRLNIMRKLDLDCAAALVRYVLERGWC
ncbi:response regulator [Plasticicumulans acidivorans]|uniref:LuxR family two component transcriptional regulator n=1 Tax=Plasticicumulans acidivorans TaxID=886464 RepID=A0A317MW22_9GAMM|nr:response regulator transcription factor [Plasticicumulans acidivorans]PWV58887.1 LuxR family two component transcriptional regulator [Plasticicumulans acidivorans]